MMPQPFSSCTAATPDEKSFSPLKVLLKSRFPLRSMNSHLPSPLYGCSEPTQSSSNSSSPVQTSKVSSVSLQSEHTLATPSENRNAASNCGSITNLPLAST